MIRFLIPLAALLWTLGSAAATSALFPDARTARVLLDDRVTRDAAFLWDVLAAPARLRGLAHVKEFRSRSGKLHVICEVDRFKETRECRIELSGDADGGVHLDEEMQSASIVLAGAEAREFRSAIRASAAVIFSPDEKVLICTKCNEDGSEAWLSWARDSR